MTHDTQNITGKSMEWHIGTHPDLGKIIAFRVAHQDGSGFTYVKFDSIDTMMLLRDFVEVFIREKFDEMNLALREAKPLGPPPKAPFKPVLIRGDDDE